MNRSLAYLLSTTLIASPSIAFAFPPSVSAPILSGGKAGTVVPYGFQRDQGFVSPFSPNGNSVSCPVIPGVVSAAQRTANRICLTQWGQDINIATVGGIGTISKQTIEVGVSPGNSVDLRNTSAAPGANIIGVPGGTTIKCFNDFNNAWPVQAPCVQVGGRWQFISGIKILAGVTATTDPVVNTLTASIAGTTMTVTVASAANLAIGQAVTGTAALPIPAGCYISALGTGTGGTGTYTVSAACGTIASQAMYGGQAGELVEDGIHGGSTAIDVYCPSNGDYAGIYGSGFQRGRAFPQVNAGAYGSCGSGNSSFSTTWENDRFDYKYRGIDERSYLSGSSGDVSTNEYIVSSNIDVNMCAVFSQYEMTAAQFNCESGKFGGVASADFLDPNGAGGNQSAFTNFASVYVAGSSRLNFSLFHFENNTVICTNTNGTGQDNSAMFYEGSGSIVHVHQLDFSSNNVTSTNSCSLYNFVRMFGAGPHVFSVDRIFDGGTSGSVANTLTGVTMHIGTSGGSAVGNSIIEFGRAYPNAGSLDFTQDLNNMPSSDLPILRSLDDDPIYSAHPFTIADQTANDGADISITPLPITSGTVGTGVSFVGTVNNATAVDGIVNFANVTCTLCASGSYLFDYQVGGVFQGRLSTGGSLSLAGAISTGNSGTLSFGSRGIISSSAAGLIQLGAADAAAPVAQKLTTQNVVAGTINTAGVSTTVDAGQGTGTGLGGSLILQTAPAGSTGSAQNALVTALTIDARTHMSYGGTAPAVSACGTSPSIDAHATDTSGTVTAGAAATSCTVTFNKAFATWSHCRVTPQTTLTGLTYSYTLSAITVAATGLGGDLVDYQCDGQ